MRREANIGFVMRAAGQTQSSGDKLFWAGFYCITGKLAEKKERWFVKETADSNHTHI